MEKIEMYIVNNKFEYPIYKGEDYIPISSGTSVRGGDLPREYLRDDTGNSISEKNETFAELTVHWWLWKNGKADIVGLNHYRRYFVNDNLRKRIEKGTIQLRRYHYYYPFQREIDAEKYILNRQDIYNYLEEYDVLVKEYIVNEITVRELFDQGFGKDLCDKIEKVIRNHYISYSEDLTSLLNSHSHYHCNMFVGRKEVMNKYWQWLFEVLGYLEKESIDFRLYTEIYDKRFANAAELLFKLWIVHNKVKHRAVDVIVFDRYEKKLEKPFIRRFQCIFGDAYRSFFGKGRAEL